jgi:hypothetical protein
MIKSDDVQSDLMLTAGYFAVATGAIAFILLLFLTLIHP